MIIIRIHEDERLDDLNLNGLKIIQKKSGFKFGTDAVLLTDFVDVSKGAKVLDLGTGTGIIPILLAAKTKASNIIGIEIQDEMANMAKRSVSLNSLEDSVEIKHGDIKNALHEFSLSSFDVIVSNPPYSKKNAGITNLDDSKSISRHEILITLEELVAVSARLLKPGGQLAMVHKPERLVDIVWEMRKNKVEPKYIRFVHPTPNKKANILLIKGTRDGGADLKMMPPLYIYDQNGNYSDEINQIYSRGAKLNE